MKNWLLFIAAAILANGLIWTVSILYLLSEPVYSTGLTISLPSETPRSDISVGDIGGAQLDSGNSFGVVTLDPRESYKLLFLSGPVLEPVAEQLDISSKVLEMSLDVSLPPHTNLLQFTFKASDPDRALSMAEAVYDSFLARVNYLRKQELVQRNKIAEDFLSEQLEELHKAETDLAEFRARSGLVSQDQLDIVATTLEELRSQRADVASQAASEKAREIKLAEMLGVSAAQANQVFLLQGDRAFQQTVASFGELQAQLIELSSSRGSNHPTIKSLRTKLKASEQAIADVVGQDFDEKTLRVFALPGDAVARVNLLSSLVTSSASAHALSSHLAELDSQIDSLIERKNRLINQNERLVALEQRTQTLRVILNSTNGALAIRETDVTATYPLVQLVIPANLPSEPISPKKSYGLIGAVFGSGFVTISLLVLFTQRIRIKTLFTKSLEAEMPAEDE